LISTPGRLQVLRRKGSDGSIQPLAGSEIRALRRIRREQPAGARYVFMSERGAPLSANGFFKTLSRAAESIGMRDVHPHLLRHATGFKLVNDGVDTRTLAAYLGHRQIANTEGELARPRACARGMRNRQTAASNALIRHIFRV